VSQVIAVRHRTGKAIARSRYLGGAGRECCPLKEASARTRRRRSLWTSSERVNRGMAHARFRRGIAEVWASSSVTTVDRPVWEPAEEPPETPASIRYRERGCPFGIPDRNVRTSTACPDVQSLDETPSCSSARAQSHSRRPAARVGQDCTKASRSALMVSASVVGMPCGNPLYVFSVPFCRSRADSGPESA
jgi:hypothetical protein